MAIDFEKLKTKAAQKDAATYAAQKADFAKVKPLVSAPVANNSKDEAVAEQMKANPSMLTAKITPITMAQTAAGVAKGSIPNAFQNQKESGLERAADIVSSGTSSLAGGAANAVRIATTGKYSPSGIISRVIDKINGTNYTEQNAANQKAFADEMMDTSRLYSQNAKRGLGKIGQAGVDIGSAATQIGLMGLTGNAAGALGAGSEATGALTKGLMAIQQAGQGAYDAEKAGAGEGTQALYGLLQGATGYATEGISNVGALGKVFGNGAVDSKIEQASAKAISKFIKSDAGRAVANRFATGAEAGLGEALEQNIRDALTPVYQRLTYDKNAKLNAEDMIYNGIVAGAVGGIVGSAGKNNLKALETENDARAAESRAAAAEAAKAPPVTNTAPNLSQVAPNLIKPTQNIAQEAAQAPTVSESAKEVKLPVETENALKTQQGAPETKASIFPEDSLGAKITTPKSNIPLETGKDTASVQNAQNNELGAMNTQFPYKEAPTQSILSENQLTKQEKTENALGNTHQVYTNEMARAQAQQRLTLDYDGEKADLLKKQDWDKGDDVTAQYIIKQETEQARKTGDWTEAKKIWKVYQEHGTTAGQALQARQQFQSDPDFVAAEAADTLSGTKVKKLPQGTKQEIINKVYEQANTFDNLQRGDTNGLISLIERNNEIRHTTGIFRTTTSKYVDNMLHDYLNAYGEQGEANLREIALSQIRSIASDYEKTPMIEKVSSLYINGLLSKVSTAMRNVVGNTGFDILDSGANNVAVPLDALVSRLTGTRSISADKSWLSSAKRQGSNEAFARSCIETALDVNTDGAQSKFEQSSNRTFKMTGNFAERLFSTYERNIAYLLTTPDEFAKGGVAAESARGLNELAAKGKITDTEFLKSRPQELAKQRTFQDDSNLAKGLEKLRDAGNSIAGVKTNNGETVGLGTFTVPFARVPANLVNEAINYSPAGIVKGGTWLAKTLIDAKSGNLDINAQANAVTDIGRGLTGTAMIALATALAAKGIVKVSNDKDWDKAALEKAENKTGTQLNASAMQRWLHNGSAEWKSGDSLVNVGFADPFNTFLATGALISDSYKADGKLTAGNLANSSASAIIQSIMDLPAISTLSSLQSGYNYSKSDTEAGKVKDAALSYAQSAGTGVIPNFVKGIAAGTDQYSRDTSADTKKQQFLNQLMSGIPGAREKLPIAYDALGNEKTSGSTPAMQFLNNNILPGTVTNYKPNAVTDELSRVADSTGAKSLFPSTKVDSQIKNNNQTYALDNAQKQDFLKNSGSMLQDYLKKLIGSRVYQNSTDEEKADLINNMSGYSMDKSKASVVTERGGKFTKSGYDNVAKAEQAGIEPDDFYAYKKYLKDIDPDGGNATQLQEAKAIDKTDLTTQMKGKLWQMQQSKDTKLDKNPFIGTLAQKGLAPEKTIEIMEAFNTIDDAIGKNYVKADKGPSAAQVKAAYLVQWLTRQGYNANQRAAITDVFTTWQMIPIDKPSKKATAFVNANPMP